MEALNGARDALDQGARGLAGEQVAPAPMDLGAGAAPGADLETGMPDDLSSDLDAGGDGFDATDAAAGGPEALGRERR